MNRNIILGSVAFLMGAIAGSLIATKILEKKYAALAEEEINSVKDSFRRDVRTIHKETIEDEMPEEIEKPVKFRQPNGVVRNAYEEAKAKYNLMSRDPRPDPQEVIEKEDEEDTDEEKTEDEVPEEFTINTYSPYLIDDIEFSETFNNHDKITLYYYAEDDTLSEENEQIIDDVNGVIGYDNLDEFNTQNTIYIRNERFGVDYEVLLVKKSYQEMIMGMEPLSLSEQREIRIKNRKNRRGGADEED